jgi:PGF-pre-PGF domain-containing protein
MERKRIYFTVVIISILLILISSITISLNYITINSPINNSYISGTTQLLNVTTDEFAVNVTFMWINDSEVNVLNTTMLNDTASQTEFNTTFDTTTLTEGDYLLNITAYNSSGTMVYNESIELISVDNSFPFITYPYLSPANNSNLSLGFVVFNVTVTDLSLNNVQIEFYEIGSGTNSSLPLSDDGSDNWGNQLNVSLLGEGYYNATVNATDDANFNILNGTIYFYIDRTAPAVSMQTSTGVNFSTATPSIQFVSIDDLSGSVIANCSLYVNSILNTTNSSTLNGTQTLITSSSLTDGTYTTFVNCTDGSGNTGNSSTISITVDTTTPAVTFSNPANNTNVSSGLQTFNATITDATIGLGTVLFMFSTNTTPFNVTATNTSSNWNVSVNLSSLVEAVHTVTIFANDSVGNINQSESIQIVIDRTGPVVTLINASFNTTDSTPDVTFNMTDNLYSAANCTLYLNGTSYGSNLSVGNNTNETITVDTALTTGDYNATVNCTDSSNNVGASTNSITIGATITVASTSSSSSSSSSSLGSGGGSAVTNGINFQQSTWQRIVSGTTQTMSISKEAVPVSEISFKMASTVYGAWIKVQTVETLASSVNPIDSTSFSYLHITKSPTMKDQDISEIEISFSVDNDWITSNNLQSSQVSLYHFVDDVWVELSTSVDDEDEENTYFVAESSGFSYYAIAQGTQLAAAVSEEVESPVVETTVEEESQGFEEVTESVSSSSGAWLIAIIVILALAAIIYYSMYGKKNTVVSKKKKR